MHGHGSETGSVSGNDLKRASLCWARGHRGVREQSSSAGVPCLPAERCKALESLPPEARLPSPRRIKTLPRREPSNGFNEYV
jgi:hypothetical protein